MLSVPKIIFVGGFLGAGKTTLILQAARTLQRRGQRVALIMNDQDSELVDTKYAQAERMEAREVAGGCFCCRFSDLLERARELHAYNPEIIFAEPVGSCIDISATILQPLHALHRDSFWTAPLTVLLDPELTNEVLSGQASSDVAYLFNQQIREADILCVTKSDLHPAMPELPFPVDFHISARTGAGVDLWLDEVLNGRRVAGSRLLDVDYERYAHAEAALAWLNVHALVCADQAVSPAQFLGPLLDKLDAALTSGNFAIAHLKLFDRCRSGYVMASIGVNGGEPDPQGNLIAEPAAEHELSINIRAIGDADGMQKIVTQILSQIAGSVRIMHCRAFHPSPPKPEYRFSRCVELR